MTQAAAEPTVDAVRARLETVDQSHLLAFYDELDEPAQQALIEQIAGLDLERVPTYVEQYVRTTPDFSIDQAHLEPVPYYPRDDSWDRTRFHAAGEDLLRAGKVAAFTVAGGQGSRLGYDGPKGCFPAGAVTGKPIFACLADWLLAAADRYTVAPPWYIMTSPLNHEATVEFFEQNNHFGLSPDRVVFFSQGVMPSFDMATGRILLADKGVVATNPDGHGGSLKALYESGAIDDMKQRGVEHISYFHVDNPIVRVIDPTYLGLHVAADDSSAEMSSKMVPKRDASEKVGVLTRHRGKTEVIEYSDLPEELARATDDAGALTFLAGSIGIHVIGVSFVERLNQGAAGFSLPFHRANKKVPHVDLETGHRVEPTEPNGVKLEAFVFDALPLAERSIVVETDRVDEFAPIKNAEGVDSPASSKAIQTERAARMLEAAGVTVPRNAAGEPDCTLELSPRAAMTAEELRAKNIAAIHPGESRNIT
ncbi:MAG: UDPGP type 1 family protein [Planctomycetota bacterium]